MSRVQAHGDPQAFARLVGRWEPAIRRLCTRMTGDPHRGEDLKQETFVRLYEKRRDYRPTGKFSTYLWRIALNLCYDELRYQDRRRRVLRDGFDDLETAGDPAEDLPGPDLQTAQREEQAVVRGALRQLPEIYRTVLVLRHYENLKLSQIAEVLEIPEGTVNSRMAEALSRLSRILEPQLREGPAPVPLPNPFIKQRPVL